jgi:1-acylglycerone phosphate reductase
MRLELAPLNVRVVTVMASCIKSNIAANCPIPTLRNGSRYVDILHLILEEPEWPQMPTAKFADCVVRDVVRGVTGKIWYGEPKAIMRWVFPILPQRLLVGEDCTD